MKVQIALRKTGSFLLLLSVAFFVIKFTLGKIIDPLFLNFTFLAFGKFFIIRTSDIIVLAVSVFIINRFFSFK